MPPTFSPNPQQKLAIEHLHGPMLVLAGAGTGKTTVLVERVAWLIENGHARPDEILAITFTDNSAAEMKERVEKRLRRKASISACTFHAYCQGILKRSKRDFQVLIPEDVYVYLRQRIRSLELQRFIRAADVGEFLRDLRDFFDRCHEELIGPREFDEYVNSLCAGPDLPRNCKSKDVTAIGTVEVLDRWREIARAYRNSMRLLEEENLGTFGMQISNAVKLLQQEPELLTRERAHARFILIDEFQDCNSSNIILAELLAGEEQNVFAVGDPDQAIYRFRGASSAAFDEFQKRFPRTQAVSLLENQRSRGNILRVAFAAIRDNPRTQAAWANLNFERTPLQSARDARDAESGKLPFDDPAEVLISSGDSEEAADVAREIHELRLRSGRTPESMAVLYRSHFHREKIMEELAARDIPFLVKGLDVLEMHIIRDLLAVARAVANPADSESLFRICAFARYGMDPRALQDKLRVAGKESFRAVIASMEQGERALQEIAEARSRLQAEKPGVAGALTCLVQWFGFSEDDAVIQALLRFAAEWEKKPFARENSLAEFLEYLEFFQECKGAVPLLSEEQLAQAAADDPGAVQLMTVHGAKGLEFERVWVLRVISNSFPTSYREPLFEFPPALRSSIAIGDSKEVNEQEERRLFYVAITRARDRLVLGSRPGRGQDTTPPGFLRPLLQSRGLEQSLRRRDSSRLPTVESLPYSVAGIAQWMLLPPSFAAESLALSANSIETYSLCPLKFKLQRDWQVPGQAAAALQFGSAIHTVLKNYYDPAPGAPEQSAAEVIAAFRAEFGKAVIEDPVQRNLYEQLGTVQLEELVRLRPRASVPAIAAEASFEFTIGKLRVRGRMDRIDRIAGNEVRVIDYKTGAPKDQKYADASLQLSIYAMGAAEMQLAPRELVLLNVQNNQELVTTRTRAQLEKARMKIREAAEGIAAGEFDPRTGMHCNWCAFQRLCPATEQRMLVPVKSLTAGVNA